jgi:hypothetical protein
MESLPKIVSARMRRTRPGSHPDPDQLTALIESSLGEGERSRVLEHLSACMECRELVYLASAPFESEQTLLEPGRRSGWLSWPVLRWGAIAACGLVVGTAVTLHYESSTRQKEQSVAILSGSDAGGDRARLRGPSTGRSDESSKADVVFESPLNETSPTRKISPGQIVVLPATPQRFADSAMNGPRDAGAAKATPAAAPALKDETKKNVEAKTESSNARARNELAKSDQPAAAADSNEPTTGKAKEPLQDSTEQDKLAASAPETRMDGKSSGLVLAPRWTLSAEGILQRSFDAGKTWQSISVGSSAKLRAVAAVGNEIWAGGEAGALYHSADAGNRWSQVTPMADGNALTAEIIGIEFTDPQHGRLATVGGVTWATADGGQTWSIQ